MNPSQKLPSVVSNACRGLLEGTPTSIPHSQALQVRDALGHPDTYHGFEFKDGTILLVVPPPKPVIDTIKDRLVRMTPGQHRIALQRITDVLSRIEDATTNDMAQVKAWLAEGLKVRHQKWRPEEWVWLNGTRLQDENGKTWDPVEFFEEHPNQGTWGVVP